MEGHPQEMQQARKKGGADHAALYVSLYMVVLAFFILLQTISTLQEQKIREAVKSVNKTFSRKPEQPHTLELDPEDPQAPGDDAQAGQDKKAFLDALATHAYSFIDVKDLEVKRRKDMITFVFPRYLLFARDDAAGVRFNPVTRGMLADMADTMREAPDSLRTEMSVKVDAQPLSLLALTQASAPARAALQAGIVARYFEDRGVPAARMAAGVHYASSNKIRFRFLATAKPPLAAPPATQAPGTRPSIAESGSAQPPAATPSDVDNTAPASDAGAVLELQ